MKKWLLLALIIIIFGLTSAFFYLKLKKEHAQEQDTAFINAEFDALNKDTYTAEGDDSRSITMQKRAIKNIEKLLEEQPTLKKKRLTAASTFMGFYLANMNARSDYCANKGIDISLFRTAFLKVHKDDLDAAKDLLFKTQEEIDSFYQLVASQSQSSVAQDMQDMANLLSISPEEACQVIEENATEFSKEMQFSTVQPLAHQYLHQIGS